MHTALTSILNFTRVATLPIRSLKRRRKQAIPYYRPTIEMEIETPKYHLTTKATRDELIELFRLRQQVFFPGSPEDVLDVDEFDSICDQIIIREKKSNQIIGTYRVISSQISSRFYSQNEFKMQEIIDLPGEKLELGRAVIHEDHRNGHVIDLLWKGIGRYMVETNSRWFFGCSSFMTNRPDEAFNLGQYLLANGYMDNKKNVAPQEKYQVPASIFAYDEDKGKNMLPPLVRCYLSAGAKVVGAPAYDAEFECFDFLTVLDRENLSPSYERRYFKIWE